MTNEWALDFAKHWVACWNKRHVEAVLLLCADDIVFSSPTALRVVPESAGIIRGKASLRRYWIAALKKNPHLQFQLISVYNGIDTIAMQYRNQLGMLIVEVVTFRDRRVVFGHATHQVELWPGASSPW